MNIGSFLATLREQRGWSVAHAAQAASIAHTTLGRWEHGDTEPRMPELKALLDALGAGPKERLHALSLLDSRRGREATRDALQLSLPIDVLPAASRLLRNLRLRGRWSGAALAGALGLPPCRITRWEQGTGFPDAETLSRLCTLLRARPEEQAALGNRSEARETAGRNSARVEELARRIDDLGGYVYGAPNFPIDLALACLQEEATRLAAYEPRARTQLARLCEFQAGRLRTWGCFRERPVWVDRGLALMGGISVETMGIWMSLAFHRGYCLGQRQRLSHLREAEGTLRNLRIETASARRVRWALLSQLHREMATAATRLHCFREASALLASAKEAAAESGQETYFLGTGMVEAALCLAQSGRLAERAIVCLPAPPLREEEAQDLVAACDRRMAWAEACWQAGESASAQEHLHQFYRIVAQYGLEHEKSRGERLERSWQ